MRTCTRLDREGPPENRETPTPGTAKVSGVDIHVEGSDPVLVRAATLTS